MPERTEICTEIPARAELITIYRYIPKFGQNTDIYRELHRYAGMYRDLDRYIGKYRDIP